MKINRPLFWDHKNLISFLLYPLSLITFLINIIKKITTKRSFKIKSICVGNLYVGGTGKTPLSIEIFSILEALKMNPAFIRKKYDSFQDEVDLLKQKGATYQSKRRIHGMEAQRLGWLRSF